MKGFGTILDEIAGNKSIENAHVEVRHIDTHAIHVNQNQPRKKINLDEIESLSLSILENGLINPITIRDLGNRYEIIAGERRWRAVCHLGWNKIPAIIKNIDDSLVRVIALVENLQREDLTPIEIANGYFELSRLNGMNHNDLARYIGKPRSSVSNYLRLLSLSPDVQKLIDLGKLEVGHAKLLVSLPAHVQIELAYKVADDRLSVRQLEMLIKKTLFKPTKTKPPRVSDERFADLALFLKRKTGGNFGIEISNSSAGKIIFPDEECYDKFFELLTKL